MDRQIQELKTKGFSGKMKIKTERRCGCRGADGKQLGKRCPRLKRKDHGRWTYRIQVPEDLRPLVGRGEIRGSGYPTEEDARADAEKEVVKIRSGRQHVGQLTVGQYLNTWLAGKRRLRPTSRGGYESNIRLYLCPMLGELPLKGLRKSHIDQMIARLEVEGSAPVKGGNGAMRKSRSLAPKTILEIFATLRAALNDAVVERLIDWNPALGVEMPEQDEEEVEPWEPEEVGRFLDEAADDRLAALYELIAIHGVRRGEACGLVDTDVDAEASRLTICRQIVESQGRLGVWPPKTKSGKRPLDIDPMMLGSIMARQLERDAERDAVGPAWNNGTLPNQRGELVQLTGLIFTRLDGRHLSPAYVTSHMQVIARRVGLCCQLVRPAKRGAKTLTVGKRYRAPEGVWTVYRDREPCGQVTVIGCTRRRGSGAVLHLAEALPIDLEIGMELGKKLLSRKRLHDLRHGSASIQIAEGVDITLVSKRLGHASPAITGRLYAHLLRSAGREVAQTAANAVPRRVVRPARPHPGHNDQRP
ncbi:phage integrase family protein [Frankia torreyi]|uniref:Phage integrase family protein n=1 Tax=Frankia torreyi TaxID=1856 RepID=A0A0D8B7D5_9ACTN|nr:tyrosine-type recombinase/integrase [Frankia torreyi]KJE20020.1 phage integrase family protein [Frankia torreyi]